MTTRRETAGASAAERDRQRRGVLWRMASLLAVLAVLGASLAFMRSERERTTDSPAVSVAAAANDGPIERAVETESDATEPAAPATITAGDEVAGFEAQLVAWELAVDNDPTYETPDEIGVGPFMGPREVVEHLDIALPDRDDAPVGLYGGTLENTCDPQRLVDYLASEPSKAQAWADVQGIPLSQLSSYILSLTPAILSVDTLVVNHTYASGVAIPIVSTLAAGTAVLVDADGVPRTRCSCGNPLLPVTPAGPPPDPVCVSPTTPAYLRSVRGAAPALGEVPMSSFLQAAAELQPTGLQSQASGITWMEIEIAPDFMWVDATLTSPDVDDCLTFVCVTPHNATPGVLVPAIVEPDGVRWTGSTGWMYGVRGDAAAGGSAQYIDRLGFVIPRGEHDRCESDCFGSGDTDADGICDPYDNCLTVANPDQANTDSVGVGDACDPDLDVARLCLPHATGHLWYRVLDARWNTSGTRDFQIEGDNITPVWVTLSSLPDPRNCNVTPGACGGWECPGRTAAVDPNA